MRYAIVGIGLLLVASSASAQTPCAPLPAYDPYKPSDLAIMREYGGTLLAQAPTSALLKLDPYVPSQGELLRQLGRGIPVWATYPWYPFAPLAPVRASADCEPSPEPESHASASAAPLMSFRDVMTVLERERALAPPTTATDVSRTRTVERSNSVWVHYAGRAWVSAGAAVPLNEREFVRIGESAGGPVFRRSGTKADVIFVPTTTGMVAPFEMRP